MNQQYLHIHGENLPTKEWCKMGIDFSKVRQCALEEEKKAVSRNSPLVRYWMPKEGKNRIRILPPWTTEGPNANQYWREVAMHFKVGAESKFFVCPGKT